MRYVCVTIALLCLQDMFLLVAMGPPGGGRMVISRRLQSRFNLINMTFPQVKTAYTFYASKLKSIRAKIINRITDTVH